MNLIICLIAGALVGALGRLLLESDARDSLLEQVLIGMAGGYIAADVIKPMTGTDTIKLPGFSLSSLLVSLLGAVALLMLARWLRGRYS